MVSQLSIIAPGLLGASVAKAVDVRRTALAARAYALVAAEPSASRLPQRIAIWARREEVRREIINQPWCDAAPETLADAVCATVDDRAAPLLGHEADALLPPPASPLVAAKAPALVVIAAPVTQILPLLRKIAPHLPAHAIVTDVGSVKSAICREAQAALADAAPHAHFVGSHPMAGSEKTGWEHAQADLFEGRTCFVTPLAETDPHATETVAAFWEVLGSKVVRVAPTEHDEIVAHISHLPQALASTLCAALARKNADWHHYAGGGLRDTTRIAGSDPQLWRTIFEQNRDAILRALDDFETELRGFRDALAAKDYDTLTDALARGQNYRQQF